jgi:hypothetical protein
MNRLKRNTFSADPVVQSTAQVIDLLSQVAARIDKASGSPVFTAAEHDLLVEVIVRAQALGYSALPFEREEVSS